MKTRIGTAINLPNPTGMVVSFNRHIEYELRPDERLHALCEHRSRFYLVVYLAGQDFIQ
jgi:hypothetical protein